MTHRSRLRYSSGGNLWFYWIRQPVPNPDGKTITLISDGPSPLESDIVLKTYNIASKKLTSMDQPELRFLVVPPAPFFTDYTVEVDDESLVALGLPDAEDLLILLVLTAGETAAETTANLMAPIVVAQSSRRAVQLVLGGSGLPVRAPLLVG